MHQPRAVHGIQRTTQLDADPNNLGRIEGSMLGEFGLERPSLNELHPEARAPLNTLRTVNGCDVRMADSRHQSTLVDDLRVGQTPAVRVATQQLERHFPVQAWVPRPVDVAEAAAPNSFDDAQRAPRCRNFEIRGKAAERRVCPGERGIEREPCLKPPNGGNGSEVSRDTARSASSVASDSAESQSGNRPSATASASAVSRCSASSTADVTR